MLIGEQPLQISVYQHQVGILVERLTSGAHPIPVQRHYVAMPVNYVIQLTTAYSTVTHAACLMFMRDSRSHY